MQFVNWTSRMSIGSKLSNQKLKENKKNFQKFRVFGNQNQTKITFSNHKIQKEKNKIPGAKNSIF